MFDELFDSPQSIARHQSAPLASERAGYLQKLLQSGYLRGTLIDYAEYLLTVIDYLELAKLPFRCVGKTEIAAAADIWVSRGRRLRGMQNTRRARTRFITCATRFLAFLGRLELGNDAPERFDSHIAEFATYMSQERGLSSQTIGDRCATVRDFLRVLMDEDSSLERVRIADIDKVLAKLITERGYARVTVQTYATTLRAFFRYAEARQWCDQGLAAAIMSPRVFRYETLPAGPSWEQVQNLLASTAGDRPVDIRDHAILLLLSVYGLRAGEVAHLRLEDMDWQNEMLFVCRSKRLGTHKYPLVRCVGNAVLRYLREVRPRSSHREVFLTLNAPHGPISSSVLWPLVSKRLRPIAEGCKHYGPHALRHACATRLINEGHTLKEIGDHLGHRNADSTRIYAKVNLTGLREVAAFDLGGLL